nr:hypothetical protein GCM10025732_02840 [Glycomyces mayteni]
MDVDWETLRGKAREAMAHAYVPYSKYPVGVAGLVDDGRIVSGCNVENASYGLTLCAECGMVSQLAATGGGRLVAIACVDGAGSPSPPADGAASSCSSTAARTASWTRRPGRPPWGRCSPVRSARTTCPPTRSVYVVRESQ